MATRMRKPGVYPGRGAAVVPSDTVDIKDSGGNVVVATGLYIAVGGILKIIMSNDNDQNILTLSGIISGSSLSGLAIRRILSNGTTCTGMVAFFD